MEAGPEAPVRMTPDEQRALAFIAALLLLSAAVRVAALPEPMAPPTAAGFDLDGHIAAAEGAAASQERRSRPLARGERLDPNTAAEDELDRLPGVGPAMARRIVEARAEGRFRSLSDLARVRGMGDRTLERLAPHLTLPPALSNAPTARQTGAPEVLNLNTASAEALTTLSGVGPVLAGRIVAHRDSAGRFLAVDSLMAVPGIGPAKLDRLRARVSVR